jgi:hypothetical protein
MDLSIFKNNDKSFKLSVQDQNGDVINVSGGELHFNVTDWRGLTTYISKTSTNPAEIEILDNINGIVSLNLVPSDTSSLEPDEYLLELNFINSLGKNYTIATGEFHVLAPGALQYIRKRLRNFTGDKEDLNILLQSQETTDEELNGYIRKAIDYFNSVGYQTNYSISDFPNLGILIQGTAIEILAGKGILSARNMLTYTDNGGVTVQDYDTYGRYVNLFNVFIERHYRNCLELKRSINVEQAYGSIQSPMQTLDNDWDSYW